MKRAWVFFSLALLGVACGVAPSQPPREEPRRPPLRLCVMQDLSGSIRRTRTVVLTPEDLRALAEVVKARTGELGFGIIGERSDQPLERLPLLEPPPEPPGRPPTNPLLQEAWRRRKRHYDEALEAYDRRVQQRVEAFVQAAGERLQRPKAPVTDVCGAIRRCDLMLAEPFPGPVENVMVLITDGLHNVRSSPCPEALASKARVLLVNGEGTLGVVQRYNPIRFESPGAVLRFLRAL
ncbi:MAG: hypothetical protein QN153_12130 [Armatimonadota bacterium]|nr:hypothetical protein [Armatimonadota bacterium]